MRVLPFVLAIVFALFNTEAYAGAVSEEQINSESATIATLVANLDSTDKQMGAMWLEIQQLKLDEEIKPAERKKLEDLHKTMKGLLSKLHDARETLETDLLAFGLACSDAKTCDHAHDVVVPMSYIIEVAGRAEAAEEGNLLRSEYALGVDVKYSDPL